MPKKSRKHRFSRKSILFLISTFVVLAILIIGIVMFSTRGREVKDSLVLLPYTADSASFAVDNTIVYSDGALLKCVDTDLNIQWQYDLFTDVLSFEANDKNIVAYGANVIHVIDSSGKYLFSTKIEGDIKSARICADKIAVYVTQETQDETRSYIIIFDLAGQSLHKIDITDKYVLAYDFDSNSDELYILELDASGAAPVSRISTYRAETQAMTGFMEMKDQLIDRVFIHNKIIYASGTNRLTIRSSLNEIDQKILIYGWMLEDAMLSDDPKFIYVPSNSNGTYDIARVISVDGSETVINLPPGVFSVLHTQDRIYCFASQEIFVYTGDGSYLRTHALPFIIDGMEKAMDGYVFVTQNDAVYLLPLP